MRLCLINKQIPLSWGISNIQISNNILVFDVFGSKFQGKIIIQEIELIMIVKINATEKKFMTASEMLDWLDNQIE